MTDLNEISCDKIIHFNSTLGVPSQNQNKTPTELLYGKIFDFITTGTVKICEITYVSLCQI